MIGQVVKLPRAEVDLDESATSIQRGSPTAAVRFLRSAEETFALLARSPGLGVAYEPETPELADLRYFPIHRFRKHLVFYKPIADGIEVVRVLHGARDIRGELIEGLDEEGGEEDP